MPKLKSHQIYLKMCTLVSWKVLLIWSDFEQINEPLHSPRPLKSSKIYRFSTGIEFFPITILERESILNFCQSSEYGNGSGCKILKDYWRLLQSIDIKGTLARKGLSLVDIFMSLFHSVSSVWFFKHEDSFFHFLHYILSYIL